MDNVIQRLYENHSDLLYTIIFFLGFILSLNNLANQTDDSPFWLYIMLACTFIGGYYFLNFFSRFMDKYEPTSHFADIGKPIKASKVLIIYIFSLGLNFVLSWTTSTTIVEFSNALSTGLFIIQIILFIAITNVLFEYFSRTASSKSVAYGKGDAFQRSIHKTSTDKIENNKIKQFLGKNIVILLNIINICVLVVSVVAFN